MSGFLRPSKAMLAAVCCGGFLFQADLTALAPVITEVSLDLVNTTIEPAWLIDAYSLALIFALPIAGSLADRFGRRRLFNIGAGLFGVASLACALAPTLVTLLCFRVLQGIAGALLTSAGIALLSRLYEGQSRRQAFALLGIVIGAALVIGPPLGSFLTQTAGWRWLFWINVPTCMIILALAIHVPEQRDAAAEGRPLDWQGCTLFATGTGLLCVLLLEIKSLQSQPLVSLAVAVSIVASIAGFVFVERRAVYPAFDLALLRSRAFLGVCLAPIGLSIGYWSLLVFVAPFARDKLQLSIEETGLLLSSLTLPMLLLPTFGARLASRLAPGPFFATGLLIIAFADLGMGIVAAGNLGVWTTTIALVVGGIGAALINAQITAAAMAAVPTGRAAMAAAMSVTMRQFGFALGIALVNLLVQLGSYPVAFLGAGLIAAACGFACLRLLSTQSAES